MIQEGDWVLVDMDEWKSYSAQSTHYGEGYKAEGEVIEIRPQRDYRFGGYYKEYIIAISKERYDHPGTAERTKILARREHFERTHPTCKYCKSEKIYNDKQEEWYCPWCES